VLRAPTARALLRPAAARDPELVLDLLHSGHCVHDVLRQALALAIVDCPGERDLAVLDPHFDLARVDVAVLRQALANILAEALVRPLVALRTAADERPGLPAPAFPAPLALGPPTELAPAATLRLEPARARAVLVVGAAAAARFAVLPAALGLTTAALALAVVLSGFGPPKTAATTLGPVPRLGPVGARIVLAAAAPLASTALGAFPGLRVRTGLATPLVGLPTSSP
jgi:hypothetical protein